jgi:hyaluronan synthase
MWRPSLRDAPDGPDPLTDTSTQLAAIGHLTSIAEEQAREYGLTADPWAEKGLPTGRPSPVWEHWGPVQERRPTGEMAALRTDWQGTAAGGSSRVVDRQALDAMRRSGQQPVLPPPSLRVTAPEPRASRILMAGVITGAVLGAVFALHLYKLPNGGIGVHLNAYGIAVSALIGFKLILSMLAVPARDTPANRAMVERAHVSAIITCHNEDPGAFTRCLDTLLAQSRMPDSVTMVDDASSDPTCERIARQRGAEFRALGIDYEVIRFPENQGKREGLAAGFRRVPNATVYLCIDSDTILDRFAAERLLRPFGNPRVMAVTGSVLAANRDRNLLTRLIDLRYAYAFMGERAAYSVLGSVLCVCGSAAMYRATPVHKHLDKFLNQTFLGKKCTYGDDRHMTFWCLKEGKVLLATDAVAWTLVPERMGHFLRQQVRWSKSFFRESLWVVAKMPPTRVAWWLTLIEVGTWLCFTAALLYALTVRPALSGHFAAMTYLISALLLSYARSGHYTEAHHPRMSWRGRVFTLLIAPLYGIIHMTLLLPLRVVALLTLRDNKWGTRKTVEVEA